MQSARVAVVQASPCKTCPPGKHWLHEHVCPTCSWPQESPRESRDYFSLFGIKPAFVISLEQLREGYFAASKELHPDRYARSVPECKTRSLSRMSLINEAYDTLKDPKKRREYLLGLKGISCSQASGGQNLGLASEWFELQEEMDDGHLCGLAGVQELELFSKRVDELVAKLEANAQELEAQYDKTGAKTHLEALSVLIGQAQTLASLRRDVQAKLAKSKGLIS